MPSQRHRVKPIVALVALLLVVSQLLSQSTTSESKPIDLSTSNPVDLQASNLFEEADPTEVDLCIQALDSGAYKVNQTWLEAVGSSGCERSCRCVFRSEPRPSISEVHILETINMRDNSEPTEIRCSIEASCSTLGKQNLESKPASSSTKTSTTTSTTSTTTTPALTEVSTSTQTSAPLSANGTRLGPNQRHTDDELGEATSSSKSGNGKPTDNLDEQQPTGACRKSSPDSNQLDQFANEQLPLAWIEQVNAPLQAYAWHLLVAFSIMTILFTIVSYLYVKKWSRVAPITSKSAYDSDSFTKLVSYYANTQNYNNDVILAKQKNLEVDKSSPLHHQLHFNGRQQLV